MANGSPTAVRLLAPAAVLWAVLSAAPVLPAADPAAPPESGGQAGPVWICDHCRAALGPADRDPPRQCAACGVPLPMASPLVRDPDGATRAPGSGPAGWTAFALGAGSMLLIVAIGRVWRAALRRSPPAAPGR